MANSEPRLSLMRRQRRRRGTRTKKSILMINLVTTSKTSSESHPRTPSMTITHIATQLLFNSQCHADSTKKKSKTLLLLRKRPKRGRSKSKTHLTERVDAAARALSFEEIVNQIIKEFSIPSTSNTSSPALTRSTDLN